MEGFTAAFEIQAVTRPDGSCGTNGKFERLTPSNRVIGSDKGDVVKVFFEFSVVYVVYL